MIWSRHLLLDHNCQELPGGAHESCHELPGIALALLMRNRCSSDSDFRVGVSEAKRSEAVLIQLHALILFDTFLHAVQFFNT